MTTLSPELTLAAYLADPLSAPPADTANAGLAALPGLLRSNKVSLLPAQRSGRPEIAALLAKEPLASYVADEQRAYQRVRSEYATIRAAFAGAGIADVLIKSAGVAPSFPHSSDNVDDLVHGAGIPAARTALRQLGYVELRNLEEPRKFFFKRFVEGQEAAAHHLHEHVGWAVSFLDEPLLLRRARPAPDDPEVCIPHPEDAFLTTIAHAFYENKAFKLGDLVKVRHCLRSAELDWAHMRDLTVRKGWLDGLNLLIAIFSRLDAVLYGATLFPPDVTAQAEQALSRAQGAVVAALFALPLRLPLHVSFRFSKQMFYAKCWHDRERTLTGKLYDVVRHTLNGAKLKLGIHSQQGMLVALCGVDGSGKTRHAEALINALQRCDLRTTYVWSRSGSSRLTDAFVRLGKRVLRHPPSPAGTQEQRAEGRRAMMTNPLVRPAWSALVTADLLWQYNWRVRLPLLRGRVVVCDRYTYDAIADLAAVTGESDGLWARLLVALSPRPSPAAAFLLTVPPDVAAARRVGDLSEEALARQTAIYERLAQRHGLAVIDNSAPFAASNEAIVRTAIRSYYARYHTLINALLMANPDRSSA
jgi:dTMP kinase